MKSISLGLKSFVGSALLASSAWAGGARVGQVQVQGPTMQTGPANLAVGNTGSSVFAPNNPITPGLIPSVIPNMDNQTFPGAKYEGSATPAEAFVQRGPASVSRNAGQSPAIQAAPEKLGKSAFQGSSVDRQAFSKNAAAPAATDPAAMKSEKTGIAAIDSGLSSTVLEIQKRKAKGPEGVSLGSDQADLDKLFEQIGRRRGSDFSDLGSKAGAVALKEVSDDPAKAVSQLAAHAVRSVGEAQAALAAGDKALAVQRVSDAGEFFEHTARLVENNELSGAAIETGFARMRRSAEAMGPAAVGLLRDAAIESAAAANKERAVQYANGLAAWNTLLTDAQGRPYAADYPGFLKAFKSGLKNAVSRTLSGEKVSYETAEVETFTGRSNPRVRIRLPEGFVSVAAIDESALIDAFKLAPESVVSLDEQLSLAGEGLAMHAALKFDLRTQGFAALKKKADAELAVRGNSNPLGLRGFFIAARRYFAESLSRWMRWILSVMKRFGFVVGVSPAPPAGTVVLIDGVAELRSREPRSYPRARRLATADRLGFSVIPVH
ncbi:MAG: hypothetical protein AUJ52_11875 [Elusimicrobia bacterium CG1_02_63_36]|nr:MAG: hypothetical protein AUJ52_11875 [Elusimicrobia bacterium CG1_02_63_36]PIP83760.1 MAG: hypothetical protein COR54_07870 [Elusimicrobia bacterium CG22_combo_CG10-13_8_21_14_all_63_91]PJA12023.1 MAG: hypothetical protein COX66_18270 [Elusimicrobia bacterium CG_4_10_14_0_2_um_filter_63_34]PJB25923.1 MAG: hypothetical protein CO113_06115 [Elusimicrobia bacterium CG_4_9_14_3_um_filter_62_55]